MDPENNCPGNSQAPAPIILVGNPNVGKSVIFGRLTGRYVTVANYPGTTVEVARGELPDGTPVIDTPGLNSLNGRSDDERVTREVLREEGLGARAILQVADAKNIRRALLLTLQIAEMGLPMALDLNMADEAEAHGVRIDGELLGRRLGVEVLGTVATRGEGMDKLPGLIAAARVPSRSIRYEPVMEEVLERIARELPEGTPYRRAMATWLLSGEEGLAAGLKLNGMLSEVQGSISRHYGLPPSVVLARQRLKAADELLEGVMTGSSAFLKSSGRLAGWMTHPVAGWPILLVILYGVYKFVGELGAGTLVDFMEDTVFHQWINPAVAWAVDRWLPFPLIRDLLVGEYGLFTMALSYGIAIVMPIVLTFFIAFGILEDSGYLPRLAVMLNRAFKTMGLNGKAVLPMVLGLGCDTMATLTTRILETRKERLLVTLLLALGVPCSAQLGVILGMLGVFSSMGVLIWGSVVAGTMLAVGFLAAKALPGEPSDFILELPPVRLPQIGNIVVKTLARMEWYLKEVLPLFILGTLILLAMDRTGALHGLERAAAPLISGWLQLPTEATGAFIIGFLRRDYGAAGLFALARSGLLDTTQILVSLVVITLFIPCIANVLIIIKEYGWKVAASVAALIFPLAFLMGGLVNAALRFFHITP